MTKAVAVFLILYSLASIWYHFRDLRTGRNTFAATVGTLVGLAVTWVSVAVLVK